MEAFAIESKIISFSRIKLIFFKDTFILWFLKNKYVIVMMSTDGVNWRTQNFTALFGFLLVLFLKNI